MLPTGSSGWRRASDSICSPFPPQSDEKTCEDLAEGDRYSAPPDSSSSPLHGDVTTSMSSLFVDSLTTEGRGGQGEGLWRGHPVLHT